jgi:hypothetical protein
MDDWDVVPDAASEAIRYAESEGESDVGCGGQSGRVPAAMTWRSCPACPLINAHRDADLEIVVRSGYGAHGQRKAGTTSCINRSQVSFARASELNVKPGMMSSSAPASR